MVRQENVRKIKIVGQTKRQPDMKTDMQTTKRVKQTCKQPFTKTNRSIVDYINRLTNRQ